MSLAQSLLDQAKLLLELDPKRPKQVNLRRSTSSAYYALFHLLCADYARLFCRSVPHVQNTLGRTLNHLEMKKVSQEFLHKGGLRMMKNPGSHLTIPLELQFVCEALIELQEMRHLADYDALLSLSRSKVRSWVSQAELAFEQWIIIRNSDVARLYLAAFTLSKHWDNTTR